MRRGLGTAVAVGDRVGCFTVTAILECDPHYGQWVRVRCACGLVTRRRLSTLRSAVRKACSGCVGALAALEQHRPRHIDRRSLARRALEPRGSWRE